MCGIAGIITFQETPLQGLEWIARKLQSALDHRGPDDRGVYYSPTEQATLIHTRLSILDLTPAGHQPMSSPDGRYWITFNGEIYNFQALRTELQCQGEVFTSQTDTEVLLKLYQHYGSRCLERLRGMYAFAIWDEQAQKCFIARDPLGIKPLYYWHSGTTLVFASELRAVLASGLPEKHLSPQGLSGYFLTGSVPEPHTLIAGIHCLPGGHWLSLHQGDITQKQYWQIDFQPNPNLLAEEAIEITRHALLDSVKHHFVSDVPVGIFLSGGIDSSAIVALARQVQTGSLKTYSIAFNEEEWNEGDAAQQVAQHFGTDHTEYRVTASMGQSLLPQFLQSIDQPSIDGFNTFCVSKIAHDSGSKVVLSGVGGDELFGGYRSFGMVPKLVRWGQRLNWLPSVKQGMGWGLSHWTGSPKLRRLGDCLSQEAIAFHAYHSFRGIFSLMETQKLLKTWFPDISQQIEPFNHQPVISPFALSDQVSALELIFYMRNQLLRDSDVMSMRWGLELRVPLVDRVLLETLAQIPHPIRLISGKKLLVKAVQDLPNWVINRPKRGFAFPYAQWMETEWKDRFTQITAPSGIELAPWYRRWALFILQNWWETLNNV